MKPKEKYTFQEYLKTRHEVKIYFLIAVVFAFYSSNGGYGSILLNIILYSTIALGLAFFDYKVFRKKATKGEVIEMLGHDITEKKFPILFNLAKKNKIKLIEQIQKYSDNQCGGNVSVAIDILEREEKERKTNIDL